MKEWAFSAWSTTALRCDYVILDVNAESGMGLAHDIVRIAPYAVCTRVFGAFK